MLQLSNKALIVLLVNNADEVSTVNAGQHWQGPHQNQTASRVKRLHKGAAETNHAAGVSCAIGERVTV